MIRFTMKPSPAHIDKRTNTDLQMMMKDFCSSQMKILKVPGNSNFFFSFKNKKRTDLKCH